jgi:hypothetical protein
MLAAALELNGKILLRPTKSIAAWAGWVLDSKGTATI